MRVGRGRRGYVWERWSKRQRDEKHRGELKEQEGKSTRMGER